MNAGLPRVLTAGVIGCGRIGADLGGVSQSGLPAGWLPNDHAGALAGCDGISLESLCDPQRDRLEDAARRFGVERLYECASDLLKGSRPDLVAIATRTPGRCELIEECLAAGVRGLHVEKPLGRSLAEVRRVLARVRKAGAVLSYGTTRRGVAAYRQARALVQDGAIGSIRHICIEHGQNLLLWGHPHSMDLILFFAGSMDVDWLQASCEISSRDLDERTLDCDPALLSAFVQFRNGVSATISQGGGLNVRITGDRGVLVVESDGARVELRTRVGSRPYFSRSSTVPIDATDSGTLYCMKRLRDAVGAAGPPLFPPEEIELGMRLLLACAWSSMEDGRRVNPASIPDDFVVTGRAGDLHA